MSSLRSWTFGLGGHRALHNASAPALSNVLNRWVAGEKDVRRKETALYEEARTTYPLCS